MILRPARLPTPSKGTFLAGGVLLLALGAVYLQRRPAVRRESGLDVLLITIDTLRADALGVYGRREAGTPTIDRLGREGVRFVRAHGHNVETLPSHSNILSGRYPFEHGVRDNYGFRFPSELPTLATLLKARGYSTGAFVSAFPLASRFGLSRGFDAYDDHFLAGDGGPMTSQQERKGPETVAAALGFLEKARRPVFVWVHLYEPHFPYEPPEPFASRFRDNLYQGEVAAADAALGPLVEPLFEAGKAGRTLVVFTGDHGESLGEHGEKTHGIFAYEGPLHVPLILYCPRLLSPSTVEYGGRHVDILPTVLDALELEAPDGLRGRSLLGDVGGDQEAQPTYFEALSGMVNRRWAPLRGVLKGDFKYIDLPIPELYDLREDPPEARNLAASRPSVLESLKATLAQFPAVEPRQGKEEPETRERLASLGYVGGGVGAPKTQYTADDDPKRLISLDLDLEAVTALERKGDIPGAIALCRKVLDSRPGMPLVFLQLASLEREAGNLGAALASARRAMALGPGDPQTAAALGDYLSEAGRLQEAVALLRPFAEQVDPHPDVLVAMGSALAQLGRKAEALSALDQALKRDPGNAMTLLNIGTVHLMARDYPRAREAFEGALALNPRFARAENSLGVLSAETGHAEEAVAHWERAVQWNPREFDTLFNLGTLLLDLHRPEAARPFFERFAKEAPPELYPRERTRVQAWLRGGAQEIKKP
jgi:arylsulfatase A-like enzyme/tetratricopeptide (TPR) repeat protein